MQTGWRDFLGPSGRVESSTGTVLRGASACRAASWARSCQPTAGEHVRITSFADHSTGHGGWALRQQEAALGGWVHIGLPEADRSSRQSDGLRGPLQCARSAQYSYRNQSHRPRQQVQIHSHRSARSDGSVNSVFGFFFDDRIVFCERE